MPLVTIYNSCGVSHTCCCLLITFNICDLTHSFGFPYKYYNSCGVSHSYCCLLQYLLSKPFLQCPLLLKQLRCESFLLLSVTISVILTIPSVPLVTIYNSCGVSHSYCCLLQCLWSKPFLQCPLSLQQLRCKSFLLLSVIISMI